MRLGYDKLVETIRGAFDPAVIKSDLLTQIHEAAKKLNLDDSHSGLYSKLQRALSNKYQSDGSSIWPWIRDVFGDGASGTIVYSADNKLYSATYKISADAATLGTPARVTLAYIPATSTVTEAFIPDLPENDLSESLPEDADLMGDLVPLREAALSPDGRGLLKLIAPGQGSSGYYPKRTLMEAAKKKVFGKGMQMFMDHATDAEERDRPEGSLKNLMGVLESDAEYQEDGPDGPGLYSPVRVYEDFVPFVNTRFRDIGNSIRAAGRVKQGQVGGKSTKIIEELAVAKSVDFVTRAGAGGKLVPLFESFRQDLAAKSNVSAATSRNPTKETKMDEKQLQELQDSLRKLQESQVTLNTENARLREAVVRSEALEVVAERLAASETKLPDAAKKRVVKHFKEAVIPQSNGTLDRAALTSQIDAEIKAEADYLKEAAPARVTGMGDGGEPPKPATINLEESAKEFNKTLAALAGIKEAK